MTHDAQRDQNAYGRLRAELLTSGLSDWVSLAEVQQIISHFELADTDKARQDLVLGTIRSLREDGLMQIGELPGPDETFPAWEPIDVAMDRLHKRFIESATKLGFLHPVKPKPGMPGRRAFRRHDRAA